MQRQAKASSTGSTFGTRKLIGLLALAVAATLAFAATPAFADYVEVGSFATNPEVEGGAGSADGQLSDPGQLDVNQASGQIYVADTANNRVEVFKPTATAGEYDSQAAHTAPSGLAIDQSTGDVYVAGPTGISKLTSALAPIAGPAWTDPGVTGTLAVDPSTGDLLVADQDANLIRRFESDGTVAGTFAAERPLDVAANSSGEIFVVTSTGDLSGEACTATSAVVRYSGAGVEVGTVGTMTAPSAVAIDPDDDSIVASALTNQYWCGTSQPQLVFFDAAGVETGTAELAGNAIYATIPGLAALEGSSRVYALTKAPLDDIFGQTKITALEDLFAPDVTIDPIDVDKVGATEAVVSGTVDPNGAMTTFKVEYRQGESAPWLSASVQSAGSGESPMPTGDVVLTGLQANFSYEVRLVAVNAAATVDSAIEAFVTDKDAPAIEALGADEVTPTSAILRARVNPNGEATTYRFEYGTSLAYGNTATAGNGSVGSGIGLIPLGAQIYELQPGTTYHYRIVATNPSGTRQGPDTVFATPAVAPACPNAELRSGLSAMLPDCRAYELVSPQDNGGVPAGAEAPSAITPLTGLDGNSVMWRSPSVMPNTGALNGAGGEFRSTRTASGWTNRSIYPKGDTSNPTVLGSAPITDWRAEDLSGSVLRGGELSVFPGESPAGLDRALFLQGADPDELTWITKPTIADPKGNAKFVVTGASDDLSRIVFTAFSDVPGEPVHLIPEDAARVNDGSDPTNWGLGFPGSGAGLYEYVEGELRAVGVLPDGTIPPNGAYSPESFSGAWGSDLRNQVSRDGRRILFMARPTGSAEDSLYMRVEDKGGDQRTVVVSKSMVTGLPVPSSPGLSYASPDGSRVWFMSGDQLTADAPVIGGLYRFDLDTESVVFESAAGTLAAPTASPPFISSPDGSRFLYVRFGTFADPVETLWLNDHGQTRMISPVGESPREQSRVTSDGSRFLFINSAEFGGGQYNNGGGFDQAYVYDVDADKLICASCPPPGVQPQGRTVISNGSNGASGSFTKPRGPRAMSADGSRVFFDTVTPLVSRDVNGVNDVYRWTEQGVALISSGTSEFPSMVADSSPSGDDVFFTTAGQLTSFDTDRDVDVYDARVGGGFRPPQLTDPCDLDCQGTPSAPPQELDLGSSSLDGAGNLADCGRLESRLAQARKVVQRAQSRPKRVRAKKQVKKLKRQVSQCRVGGRG